jgi:hypothetical protein
MPYEASRSGPQTWEIALNLEHWDTCFLENRFSSGVLAWNVGNTSLASLSMGRTFQLPEQVATQLKNEDSGTPGCHLLPPLWVD